MVTRALRSIEGMIVRVNPHTNTVSGFGCVRVVVGHMISPLRIVIFVEIRMTAHPILSLRLNYFSPSLIR